MKPGEAIDYLRGGANRRVTAQVSGVETMFRWRSGLESCVCGKWGGCGKWGPTVLTHFTEYSYEKTREIPLAPSLTTWSPPTEVDEGRSLIMDLASSDSLHNVSPSCWRPIESVLERDIQAARVAEFDTRPEPEETAE